LIEQWKPVCNEQYANRPEFDLIAGEGGDVNPDFVVRERNVGTYTVPYDAVNAILLKEFVKEHRKMEEQETILAQVQANAAKQEAMIADLRSRMQALTATVKKQASQIQKANATFGMSRPSLQFAENNH
jgi:ABC-type Fe3+-hydroxamate transport system substrate-binding protein